jgi:hypothetical protein
MGGQCLAKMIDNVEILATAHVSKKYYDFKNYFWPRIENEKNAKVAAFHVL